MVMKYDFSNYFKKDSERSLTRRAPRLRILQNGLFEPVSAPLRRGARREHRPPVRVAGLPGQDPLFIQEPQFCAIGAFQAKGERADPAKRQIYLTAHDSNLIDLRDISFEILIRKFGQPIIEKRKHELTSVVQKSFEQNRSLSRGSLNAADDDTGQSGRAR